MQRATVIQQQARDALGPFERYLLQARANAQERQKRHRFRFEIVRRKHVYRLHPLDTLVVLRAPASGLWLLEGWPAHRAFDLARKLNNVDRQEYIRVASATPVPSGLLIGTDSEQLRDGDRVEWYGQECVVRKPAASSRPQSVATEDGQKLVIRWWGRVDEEDALCLEGSVEASDLVVDGQPRECSPLAVWAECTVARDSKKVEYALHGNTLRLDEPLAGTLLQADKGVRLEVEPVQSRGRSGNWVQLLLPDDFPADQALLDPRAEFCEGEDVREIWTAPERRRAESLRIFEVDRDRYQLRLKDLPPKGTDLLYAPLDTRALDTQKRAVQQLRYSPLPAHRGLIRLCENPEKARWPEVPARALREPEWELLTDSTIDGTEEQRSFVRKSLATTDIALLQGPPGSGKTTAICELVLQAIKRGERVLMCATTHVAIDNALEKLYDKRPEMLEAVRIGIEDRVDEKVRALQLDRRIQSVLDSWRSHSVFADLSDDERWEAAQSLVVTSANLTCSTTAGILNHPQLRSQRFTGGDRPLTSFVPWDLLIVDEASKTTVTEFIIPALLARKHIIVGDVQQLPPFTNTDDLEANIAHVSDDAGNSLIPQAQQRARLIAWRLTREQVRGTGVRWLIVETGEVLDHLERELLDSDPKRHVARVTRMSRPGSVARVVVADVAAGSNGLLRVAGADWVLVDLDVWSQIHDVLPAGLTMATGLADPSTSWSFRHAHSLARSSRIRPFRERGKQIDTRDQLERLERDFLSRRSWAAEVAWRLKRSHELRWSADRSERERMQRGLDELVPQAWKGIREAIADQRDIGLPSVIEVVQEGVGHGRSRRPNFLAHGLRAAPQVLEARFECLTFQHRMHADISNYSRSVIYERLAKQAALRDANTIPRRDAVIGWDFAPEVRKRRVWIDIHGSEHRGINEAEVNAMRIWLQRFIEWAQRKGPPTGRKPPTGKERAVWEVACLCFYVRQEEALSEMVREVTGSDARHCFLCPDEYEPLIEIRCGTVDRFQGREADLALLSMRNTGRVGFLDSPNRINVGVTRARQQLIIFGKYNFYAKDDRVASELKELATMTPRVNLGGRL
ncbi:MAG: AAA family ATPase [Phycisphaeraceae bacterium]|nr:AAA family ATPase [Phycisphaeraceae bacterium]